MSPELHGNHDLPVQWHDILWAAVSVGKATKGKLVLALYLPAG